ncbi:phospholipid carrier-dependent glycosyltransferase [Nodosilinea sp. LEGE 07298]|uniref:phospholipid carrier-dependent glycosyltransferase n=1 Tax=Nodosilinea sp. LEGE 07298 TaxID=2777970 RepID=UPI0018825CC8|nr:phospholipid carrier-dependent glycosyltransferase [Nodosilinea sp. LEGE 07298]MBE9109973.1 phospholipid carrier-dependent glycosyltransferase [Nodosilinea sp. LEGE 07298]
MVAVFLSWLLFLSLAIGPVPLAVGLTYRYQPRDLEETRVKMVFSIVTLWCLGQVCLGLVLGSLGLLALRPVLAAETTLAIAGLIASYRWTKGWARLRWNCGRVKLAPYELLLLLLLGSLALVLLERIATQPFNSYDTLWFHGPIVARWYQTASFSQLDPLGHLIIDHPTAQGYPYTWHVLSLLCLLPWGQDLFAALPMLFAWVWLGLSVYLLGRYSGAARFYSIAAAALVLVGPFLLNQVTTLYVDLPLAAVYCASLCCWLAYHRHHHSWDACLSLVMAGLMVGIKTAGLLYAAVIVVLFLWSFGLPGGRSSRPRSTTKPVLLGIGIVLGVWLGGFWYLGTSFNLVSESAELVATGTADIVSPILGDDTSWLQRLWEQVVYLQSHTLTSQFNPLNLEHWSLVGSQALVRFQLPLLALLAPALLLPYSWYKCPSIRGRRQLAGLGLLLLITFLLYWNLPYSSGATNPEGALTPLTGNNMRYGFPALGVLGAVSASSATQLRLSQRWTTLTVVVSIMVGVLSSALFDHVRNLSAIDQSLGWPSQIVQQLARQPREAIASLGTILGTLDLAVEARHLTLLTVVICLWGLGWCWPTLYRWCHARLGNWHWAVRWSTSLLLVGVVLVVATAQWLPVRETNRTLLYGDLDRVLARALQPGDRIAYFSTDTTSSKTYLLYGQHFTHEVIRLSPSRTDLSTELAALTQARTVLVAIDPDQLNPEYIGGETFANALDQGALELGFEDLPWRGINLYRVVKADIDRASLQVPERSISLQQLQQTSTLRP